MDDKWSFGFSLPDLPKGKKVTADQAEVLLQSRLREKRGEFEEAVWQLVRFYSSTKRQELAAKHLSLLMGLTDDPERQAAYWLALGQSMEQIRNYQEAVNYYKQAFSMEPVRTQSWYFINNNLGYSLIQLEQFADAEPYCRAAIEIDPRKHNAYKNLGLSLQGQARYPDAARSFILAVRANAADPRALRHLEALLEQHPDILSEVPEISDLLTKSRDAVQLAASVTQAAIKDQFEGSQDLTHAEEILLALHRIVLLNGREEFSKDDVRKTLGLSDEDWRSGYRAIFRAMREDQPEGAAQIDEKYRNLLRTVRHGVCALTPHGSQVVGDTHKA